MFQDDKCIQIVLGNESCDLDSAVGAISYAFLLQVVANHIGLLTKHYGLLIISENQPISMHSLD